MNCATVRTGEQFLQSALAHLDCQSQAIGAYGFGALADPGSSVSLGLSALLTIFIALFGIRLLFSHNVDGRDVLLGVLRVAIVLTLATSWPAWRVVGYDLVILGPDEVFRSVGLASGLPGSVGDLAGRLQNVDAGLAALGSYGSGRLGVANGDWFQLGFARDAYLTGVLFPMALIRIGSGVLLAMAPLVAGLLLFETTRPLFAGWAKALAMFFLASIAVSLVEGSELALMEPWLSNTLAQRAAGLQTIDAPVEVLTLTLSFALAALGLTAVVARIAFNPNLSLSPASSLNTYFRNGIAPEPQLSASSLNSELLLSRADRIALAVNDSILRENRTLATVAPGSASRSMESLDISTVAMSQHDQLGSSYRRTSHRNSTSTKRRDNQR